MDLDNELYIFAEDHTERLEKDKYEWQILSFNSSDTLHDFLKESFKDFIFEDKKVLFVSANSISEANHLINEYNNVAVIFMDVSKGKYDAALQFIEHLRVTSNNQLPRIILCGEDQPGKYPVLLKYDVEGNIETSELRPKDLSLLTTMAIRSFKNLLQAKERNQELEDITKAASRFVPGKFLNILGKESIADIKLSDHVEQNMTVLFLDVRSFTSFSEFSTPLEVFEFINDCMAYLAPCIIKNKGFIDKHIGDAILALFPEKPEDAIQAAIDILRSLEDYNYSRIMKHQVPVQIGIGINSGPVVLGAIGFNDRTDCTVIGDTVNAASRVEASNKIFNTNLIVSSQTYMMLKKTNQFHSRSLGKIHVKGKKQMLKIYEIFDADPEDIRLRKNETKIDFEKAIKYYQEGDFIKARRLFETVYSLNRWDYATKHFIKECESKENNS